MEKKEKSQSNTADQLVTTTRPVISKDNLFVEKLNSLKEFHAELPKESGLPVVSVAGGFFGHFNHSVTGEELNNLTEKIQEREVEQNKTIERIIQELETVYDTISALDEVTVQEIVGALNTAFNAIGEVEIANERINKQQIDIQGAQQDINQVIDQQKQIIQNLKKFKERLEGFKYLYDIDDIFDEVKTIRSKIRGLEEFAANIKPVADSNDNYETLQNKMAALQDRNVVMSKSLMVVKAFSTSSVALSILLLILIITGTLR